MEDRLIMIKRYLLLLVVLGMVVAGGAAAQDEMASTVALGGTDELGPFLTDGAGMTLYVFAHDEPGMSNCSGDCAAAWPPLTVEEGENPSAGPGVAGVLGVIAREDGLRQVTFNGWPLYYWKDDMAAGDTTGQGVNDVWWVASTPAVGLGTSAIGPVLVNNRGMTLYTFANDMGGVSACLADCLGTWPALTTDTPDSLPLQPGLPGTFTAGARDDGSQQIALNDMPLYTFAGDMEPGQTNGQGIGGVWFAATLPTLSTLASDEFGSMLVGPNGMTLYTFGVDEQGSGASACEGDCAVAWPPLAVPAGSQVMVSDDVMGDVTTFERPDGITQVAYNGWPLYYWINDVKPGDTTGNNVRDVWFVALP